MFGNIETCVCCGREIPEGRQVCAMCEQDSQCSNCKNLEETEFYSPVRPLGMRRFCWCRLGNEIIGCKNFERK